MIATINGSNIFYVDEGPRESTAVVFLHGFPFDHTMWKEQIALVSRSRRAVAYDIKGHGMSDVEYGQYTIEGHVDDLIGILDHLKLAKVVIVGLSMGGYVTLRALERHPERFSAAVLCDTQSVADGNEGKLKRAGAIKNIRATGTIAFADQFVKSVFAPETPSRNPEVVERIRKVILHTPEISLIGTLLALAARTDTTESLGALRIPVLILVGEHDITTPPSASQAMHERIKGSELHIVPGAAHMSNLENPVFFNEKLLAFLSRADTPAS